MIANSVWSWLGSVSFRGQQGRKKLLLGPQEAMHCHPSLPLTSNSNAALLGLFTAIWRYLLSKGLLR